MKHATPPFRSAEFSLLLACCRWPLTGAIQRDIADRAAGIDWTRFVRLSRRHRVEGIVWNALSAATIRPDPAAAAALSDAARRIALQNMALAAESVRLDRALEQAGIARLFVKGVTLGKLAYGDITRKAGWDIDLVIEIGDVEAAASLLERRGYALIVPAIGRDRGALAVWHRHSKESVWRNGDGVWVELHTGLTDNPAMLTGIGAASPRRAVEVSPGLYLPTLARDELFAYLCAHGGSSAWFRLKWIADLAALVGGESPEEIERLYRRALALGAGRSAAQALLLGDTLFALDLPADLRRELRADRVTRLLVAIALRKLVGRTGEVELDEVAFGTASIHLSQLGLVPGWRSKRAALARILVNPVDRVATPLPRGLAWLYPLIQTIRLIRERQAR